MGILSIKEYAGERGANWSVQSGRTYRITLDVLTDDELIGPRAIQLALGLSPSSTYRFPITTTKTEEDLGSYLQGVEVQTLEGGLQHKVLLSFAPYDFKVDGGADNPQAASWIMAPFAAPPTLRWGSSSEDFAVTHDRDGVAILNTVGDPFDPPIQLPVSIPVLTVSRVLKSFDPTWITYFKDSVNGAEWLGWPLESVLCQEITADRFYDADWGWLWRQETQFAFRPSLVVEGATETTVDPGWAVQILNAGMRAKLPGGEVGAVRIDGQPISKPVPLSADGRYLPAEDPHYLSFNVRRTADFSLLDLPDDLFTASTP